METQESITKWGDETFNRSPTNLRIAIRALKELVELLDALVKDDNSTEAPSEIADVVIIMNGLASRLNVSLIDEVNKKMEINRSREWNREEGRHI